MAIPCCFHIFSLVRFSQQIQKFGSLTSECVYPNKNFHGLLAAKLLIGSKKLGKCKTVRTSITLDSMVAGNRTAHSIGAKKKVLCR